MPIPVFASVELADDEYSYRYSRSSGPGGQNVNKGNTRVTLIFNVRGCSSLPRAVKARFLKKFSNRIDAAGTIQVSAQEYRSQLRNQQECCDRLVSMICSVRYAPKKRKATKPTRASNEKRLHAKKNRANVKKMRRKPDAD